MTYERVREEFYLLWDEIVMRGRGAKDLLLDAELRARLGQRGYQKVRDRYSWPKIAERYRELYHNVVARRTRRVEPVS
jgi:glycosyltransferase involved in cell wall biosynthesis